MAGKYLGDEFDIHGGGLDLRFPHHENELAQSTAAGQKFARVWMHNAWVTAAGEKMSKSLGNGALVSEVIKRHAPRAVRFYLVMPHYRSAIEYSDAAVGEAASALARIDHFVDRATELVGPINDGALPEEFAAAMDDDLGTASAVAVLFNTVREGNSAITAGDHDRIAELAGQVRAMLAVFGLAADDPSWGTSSDDQDRFRQVIDGLVAELIKQRTDARGRKDYAAADAIRSSLTGLGVELTDTPEGTRWTLRAAPTETPTTTKATDSTVTNSTAEKEA